MINSLSLPVDIAWKPLAISRDMYARSFEKDLPVKWRSSLAVYYYEPPVDPENPESDEITTYLKVVASITGFQHQGIEIDRDVFPEGSVGDMISYKAVANYEGLAQNYFPAFSALLQVAVFPPADELWETIDYPHLVDFEPKKREIVELVSETGEALTQSGANVNVRKGTTTTDTTEKANIDHGGSFGLNITSPYGGIGVSGSESYEKGTRSRTAKETVDVVTIDAAREKRESLSHTTQLSQLYHVLDSYHSGTNRALFFLNARPHIVQSPYTFVKGPRQLEGIQEFFLVMRRPSRMKNFCVKAILETGHLLESTTTETVGETSYTESTIAQSFSTSSSGKWIVNIPPGYILDESKGGGDKTFKIKDPFDPWGTRTRDLKVTLPRGIDYELEVTGQGTEAPTITFSGNQVYIEASAGVLYPAPPKSPPPRPLSLWLKIIVYVKSEKPTSTPRTITTNHVDFFISARRVSGCTGPSRVRDDELDLDPTIEPYIIYEKEMHDEINDLLLLSNQTGKEAVLAANAVNRHLRNEVISSFRSTRRYEPGQVDLVHTRFGLRRLMTDIGQEADEILPDSLSSIAIPKNLENIRTKIKQASKDLTVGKALQLTPEELAQYLDITPIESRYLITHILGVRYENNEEDTSSQKEVSNTNPSHRLTKKEKKEKKK